MTNVIVRFYAELNDRLPAHKRTHDDSATVPESSCVRDVIEAAGVPIGEVDLVLMNGESVDLNRTVAEGDRLSVYPVFESFDISTVAKLREKPLRQTRFVLDVHLGKLAYYLRMLGFDVLYRNDFRDDELISLSVDERRTLLSKDRELLADDQITRGYHVRAKQPREQLKEVLRRFDLFNSVAPLQRCIRCNILLESASKESVLHRLPSMVAASFEEFQRCPSCQRVYWKGSHYARMSSFIGDVLRAE